MNTVLVTIAARCRWLGVEQIGIVENNYTVDPGLQAVLEPYTASGFVHLEAWGNDQPKQNGAFARCFRRMREHHNWVAFFDADEFLVVLEECASFFTPEKEVTGEIPRAQSCIACKT